MSRRRKGIDISGLTVLSPEQFQSVHDAIAKSRLTKIDRGNFLGWAAIIWDAHVEAEKRERQNMDVSGK